MTEALGHAVEVEDAEGRTWRWDGPATEAAVKATAQHFRTQRGDGFADGGCRLPRSIVEDWPDLNLLDTLRFVKDDGSIDYEAKIQAVPRSTEGGHWIDVETVGWMSHARKRPFREIYVDRDLSAWRGPSAAYKLANATLTNYDPEVVQDATLAAPALETGFDWVGTQRPNAVAFYDSKGISLGSIHAAWTKHGNVSAADTNWTWQAALSIVDNAIFGDASANLRAAGPGTVVLDATVSGRVFAALQLIYAISGSPNFTYAIYWTAVAVFGRHNVTKRGSISANDAPGLYASDVMRDIINRFCPKLNPAGVQDTSYAIKQIAFKEPTDPFDAFVYLNSFHNWSLGVWENRTVHFSAPDLTRYDWQVRLDDPGVSFAPAGDSIDGIANGVVVIYTDFFGEERSLFPTDFAQLRDDSAGNPYNRHGEPGWIKYTMPHKADQAEALEVGRAVLGEYNRPKSPGTIKVRGRIRDSQGAWRPVSEVRCDQTIAIVDHPNDRPRMINDTSWTGDGKTLQISADRELRRVEPYINRVETARQAAGLGG